MSLETESAAPAPSNEPISSHDLAGMFKAELDAEAGVTPEPKPQPEAPVEAAPETESAPEADAEQPEQAEPSVEEPATPAIDAPRSMSEADKAVFEQLPPEAKAWIAKREKEAQADYTRKTQEIAEQRKQYDQALPTLINQLKQYDQILSNFTTRAPVPPDPALRQTDPLSFDEQMAAYVHAKHTHEVAQQEQSRVRAEMEQHQKAEQEKFWKEQGQKLAELSPELAAQTPEAKKKRADAFAYAQKIGFTEQQLKHCSALELVTLWKAHQFDAAMSKKPVTPPPVSPKVMQPGPAKAAGRNNGFAQSVKAFSDNPTRASLADAFRAELAAER